MTSSTRFGSLLCASVLGFAGVVGGATTLSPAALVRASGAEPAAERVSVGLIELKGAPAARPNELAWLFGSGDEPTLRQIIEAIDGAASDDDLGGIVIRLKDAELGMTQVEEIGAAIKRVRAAGKKVQVFAEGYGTTDLILGSYADEVIAQDGGAVSLPGLYMEEMFLADTLAWAGLKADFVQVGDYKGASEMMARSGPSPQWEQNISQLLDSMYANMRAPLLSGRKLTDSKLDQAMEVAWMTDAKDAAQVGLIDSQVDLPLLGKHLESAYGAEVAWKEDLLTGVDGPAMDTGNPFAMLALLSKQPDHKPKSPTIAIVHIDGAIVDGDSSAGGFMGGSSVGSRTIRNALEDVRNEDQIKGVILRIDSPGGSATASEVIWQGVRRVAAKKPVWVSVGSMAASGGYYIAVAGDKIYVNPSSIVGSIGVVGGKITMQGLYEKLKVNVVGRGRGPRATMFSSVVPWSPDDITHVREKMTETYTLFTKRVTAGRKGINLGSTAEGRLFTGNKAIGLKMADEVGGLEKAIGDLAASAGLNDYEVMDYPGPKPLGEVIEDALKGFVAAPSVRAGGGSGMELVSLVREIVGQRAWKQIEPSMTGLMQMRDEPVLLISPKVLIVK